MNPEHLNVAVILGFCAYVFLFEQLGRRRHLLGGVLLAAALLTAGLLHTLGAEVQPALVAAALLGAHNLWELFRWLLIEGRSHSRSRKRANLPARRHKRVSTPYPQSNEEVISHFTQLAGKDDLVVTKPQFNFLAWNTRQGYVIQIFLLPDGGWTSLFWSPSEFELRDKEVLAACRAAGVPCHKKMLGMRAQGIAICHDSLLTITPADQQIHFDEFLHSVLAPPTEFSAWLRDYKVGS